MEIQTTKDTVTFSVYVQPRAAKVGFAGSHLGALKIRLTAPPSDGAANKQCCELIAKTLSVPKSAVEIATGHTSRQKRIRIQLSSGSNPKEIQSLTEILKRLAQ